VLFEARGEIFNVPAKEGYTRNVSKNSGAFDRNPAWSPNGKHVAYWSDKSGEYEIYLVDSKTGAERKLSNRNGGFGYTLFWAPDSKRIAFHDEKRNMIIIDVATGAETIFDHTYWSVGHSGMFQRVLSWSPDSRWIAYSKGLDNGNNAIFLYDTRESAIHQVTSAFYNNNSPAFGSDGDYLFHLTDRALNPAYSDMGDGTWVYPNSTQIAAVSLRKDVPSLLAPKNDEVESGDKPAEDAKEGNDSASENDQTPLTIDLDGFEYRTVILPVTSGNMWELYPIKDKVVFARYPNQGASDAKSALVYYDIKERKEEVIISDLQGVVKASAGDKFLVRSQGKFGVISAAVKQQIKDPVPTGEMSMELVPKEEWYQVFDDTWRRYRDFFYDENMQQVDWDMMRAQYRPLIEDARSRWDVSNILIELISELSAGHTYAGGGDTEQVRPVQTGKLGIDWELSDGKFKIARIVRAAPWDTEVRSPLDEPGVDIKEGAYIHSVNGVILDPDKDPYAAFEGLAGKTVNLEISTSGAATDTRTILVKCLTPGEETRLRHLEWIEENRKTVDELSNGQLAYIYMPNTGGLGQRELMRMFYGQVDKKGFVIDERFNGGGQLSDRFMEMLTRPRLFNLHWRHGRDHQWPLKANDGPKAMLINGSAGSGGDALPWAFQVLDAGPIIGERTRGILVGPATGHSMIDGGYITVPGGRLYQNNSEWFWEGYGVSPDIEIWDDPEKLAKGHDPQLERAVEELLKLLEASPNEPVPAPPYEDRTASGIEGNK
jgi:tricorn protease